VLLPTEADLCNLLGLTEEEYFQFLEGVAAKVKERPEAYNLVPDLVNGPLVVAIPYANAGALTLLGQVVVGIALTAISYLLTPKPPSMKQGTNQRTADIAGLKRFAPQFSFNSVQELANLGDLIPLVFANRQTDAIDNISYGGVRANSQLLWSQMVSLGSYQQLKLLALFSLGEIARRPDLKGYAVGDLLLNSYNKNKVFKLDYETDDDGPKGENIPFLRTGGQLGDAIGNVFQIDERDYFSGTRNPTTQATFGLSNPMPNATAFRLPYELVRTGSDTSSSSARPAARIMFKKRRKLLAAWPMGAGFMNGGTDKQKLGEDVIQEGLEIHYQIIGSPDDGVAYQQDQAAEIITMNPHGVEDVNSATKTVREATDSYLAIGEQYMAGTALVECFDIKNDDGEVGGKPWDGTKVRAFYFKVIESGKFEASLKAELATHLSNPNWDTTGKFFTVRSGDHKYYYEQIREDKDLFDAYSRYTLQKVSLGTISNNRKCHITEIGLKSKVFKEIRFANVNSKPSEKEILDIYDDRSTLQLGNINKYTTRYSFFKLQVRKIGEDNWNWLRPAVSDQSSHTGLFCIRGNTPEFQYNYIRIVQPGYGQYEYRFYPWAGSDVIKEVEKVEARETVIPVNVTILNANATRTPLALSGFECKLNGETYHVKYAGDTYHSLTKDKLSNAVWNLGAPSTIQITKNTITGFTVTSKGSSDSYSITNLPETRETVPIFENKFYYPGQPSYKGGNHTVIVRHNNHPSLGETTWDLYLNDFDVTPNVGDYGSPKWENPISYTGPDPSRVAFHYTTKDGRGGKFYPSGNPVSGYGNLYAVNKTEQKDLSASKSFDNTVSVYLDDDEDSGSGLKAEVKVYKSGNNWFATWSPIITEARGYTHGTSVYIRKNDIGLGSGKINFKVNVLTSGSNPDDNPILLDKLNPYDAAADFWEYEGDRSSHLDGPEHQISYCNEIVETEGERPEGNVATYENLAYAGLKIDSAKEWTNFSQFSAYFKQGIKVKSLIDGTLKATNLFPEIAYALLTDKTIGAGKVISESAVDKENMTIAAKFCQANKFFWDGIVSSRTNLREFIYQQGLYCLLDFTIIGGKFSLYPAVPFDEDRYNSAGELVYSGTHEIRQDKSVTIKAMFTDGNVKDLSVTFLSAEDRQAFKANVLYREEEENGFPETKSIIVRLNGNDHIDDPIEIFDLSGFCTSRKAASLFAKYTLSLRKHLDHTVNFKTAPHFINGVRPGDYIRVFSTTQHVDRFNNGAILEGGEVVSKDPITGITNIYYWKPSTVVDNEPMAVAEASVNFSSKDALAALAGSLFTVKDTRSKEQCYKVESITFGEDSLVELVGSYAELTDDGKLKMLQDWDIEDKDDPLVPIFTIED